MSASAAVTDMPAAKNQAQYGLSTIRGRLTQARRPQGKSQFWSHLIVMPAPDAYTSPATVEVLSSGRLGEKDEEITVKVRIGGYRRSYRQTDQETGEQRNVQTADVKLFAVED